MKILKTNHKITEWQSLVTGNIVNTFGEVVKQIWSDLIRFHILNIKWKRTKKELELPTTIYVMDTYIHAEWHQLDECDKEEAISDYLSDTYGYCHKGFAYEESGIAVAITNIIWDLEE